MSSPMQREILTHYWVSPEPHPKEHHWRDEIDSFVRVGLLKRNKRPNKYGTCYEANREALEPYMNALGAIPFPILVQQWVIPLAEPA